MLIGDDDVRASNGVQGCTFKRECYETRLGGTDLLYALIRELDGVSLLVYRLKGRAKGNTEANWILFNKIICAEKEPIIGGRSNRSWTYQSETTVVSQRDL
jgi:hypothetical protein